MPWWICLLLGTAAYFAFHAMARMQPVVTRPDQLGSAMTTGILAGLAMLLQYLAPLFCLVAAAVSFARRAKRSGLVTNVTTNGAAAALEGMTWQDFELLVGEAFRLQGFKVEERGGAEADGGVDVVLRRDGETFLVQCKHWKSLQVSVQVVRELFGVMASQGAAGGYVVTSGTYTAPAREFASGRNIKLVDGVELARMIRHARGSRQSNPTAERQPAAVSGRTSDRIVAASTLCPICSSGMVSKRARRGPNAGKMFWSCRRYPGCTGTRPAVG